MGTNWERFQRLSWSPCHGIINVPINSLAKNYSLKNFTVGLWTTSKYWKLCSLKIKIVLQISNEISVLLIVALGFTLYCRNTGILGWNKTFWDQQPSTSLPDCLTTLPLFVFTFIKISRKCVDWEVEGISFKLNGWQQYCAWNYEKKCKLDFYGIEFLYLIITSSMHMRREISHSHMTYAETVPSWFLLNLKVVQVEWNML